MYFKYTNINSIFYSWNTDFLVHYFESPKWHKEVSNIAGEGARNHGLLNIAVPDFFNTRHWVPSNRTEQEKIAALFNLIAITSPPVIHSLGIGKISSEWTNALRYFYIPL